MKNEPFLDDVLYSIKTSDAFINDYKRKGAVDTFQYLIDEFGLNGFFVHFEVTEQDYKKYFSKTVKKYDKPQHKEYMKMFKEKQGEI